MILYKYFPPERVDVLHDLKIRFSQPAIYNDPFELRPVVISLVTEGYFNIIKEHLINHYLNSPVIVETIRKISCENFMTDPSYILGLIQEEISSKTLALCLTEIPDSLLMWAHYGSSHKGFIIGFDKDHEFFVKSGCNLKRIIYQERRPVVLYPNPSLNETYFTKSPEWEYEKEWRLLRREPLDKSTDGYTKDGSGLPIYLFNFPIGVVKEIILGCRMDSELQNSISVLAKEKFPEVCVKVARLSDKKYELTFLDIHV